MIDIRLPNITAINDRGQLEQIRSYLFQFAQQLSWALNEIDKKADSTAKKVEETGTKKKTEQEAQATFSEIKSLIIKSADIVNAYYEEISHRLEGEYVAQSDFGEYRQETTTTIKANSTNIEALFENTQVISSDLEELSEAVVPGQDGTTIIGSQAWCTIGVLGYEESGFPIYGMEIGQTNTQGTEAVHTRFAQYRSDGVHLYDQNGTEVATIINNKLKINNAEMINAVITNALTLGGYNISTGNGLAFKWTGRG